MDKKLNTLWFQNDSAEQKDKTEKTVRNNVFLMTRLKEILESELEKISRTETSLSAYDNPSWAHKQAHNNGMRHAYTNLLKLTDFL